MWLGLILLAQLLHREIVVPVEVKSSAWDGKPAKSEWPLEECLDTEPQSGGKQQAGCVCDQKFQVCQPLQLSAPVNGSITLPCRFSYNSSWEPSSDAQVHWRLGGFHSERYLFNCCRGPAYTDPDFQGRVSLAREEAERGQQYTAAVSITALRESDSRLYFCRVSVVTPHGKEEWQTIKGTNLTVTASPQQPEGRNRTTSLPPGLLAGVSTGAVLLAAAILLGLTMVLLAQGKGHCRKRTQTRRAAGRGQEEKEAEDQELHCRGARAPPREKPLSPPTPIDPGAQGEPGLVYASLQLFDAPNKKRALERDGRADEETTYAAVWP